VSGSGARLEIGGNQRVDIGGQTIEVGLLRQRVMWMVGEQIMQSTIFYMASGGKMLHLQQ